MKSGVGRRIAQAAGRGAGRPEARPSDRADGPARTDPARRPATVRRPRPPAVLATARGAVRGPVRAASRPPGRSSGQPVGGTTRRPTARHLDPKRLLDLTLGSALLVLASPVLAGAALAAALGRPAPEPAGPARPGTTPPGAAGDPGDSAGPLAPQRVADRVLVRDYRVGLHGRPFLLRSLRTRRWRLDLLSRLPHVVRGDLSLVGPAPLKVGSPAAAPPWRALVRPGLTGLAQVRRHSPLPWDEAALLDQHYVEHHWIGLDLLILVRTPAALPPGRPRPRARDAEVPAPRPRRTAVPFGAARRRRPARSPVPGGRPGPARSLRVP